MSKEKQELVISFEGLVCVDCVRRKPDTELFGKKLSNASDKSCEVFEEKPTEYMWGKCPYHLTESQER